MVAASFQRTAVAQFLQAPLAVIQQGEGGYGCRQFGPVAVGVSVDDLLFDGAVEAFDHAVGLRLTDEGEARGKAVEAALPLEVVGEVLAAVVVA